MRGKLLRNRILRSIESKWPTHIKELVRNLNMEMGNNSIKKISYHVRELEKNEKVNTKRVGMALIIWPNEMEKLRMIHELLKTE